MIRFLRAQAITVQHFAGLDTHLDLVLTKMRMEMRRRMIAIVHGDDAEEPTDFRHVPRVERLDAEINANIRCQTPEILRALGKWCLTPILSHVLLFQVI